jgi:hypothetical protein
VLVKASIWGSERIFPYWVIPRTLLPWRRFAKDRRCELKPLVLASNVGELGGHGIPVSDIGLTLDCNVT